MNVPYEEMDWSRSSFCSETGCVEMAFDDTHVYVRDSQKPAIVLTVLREDWRAFIAGVEDGEFAV